MIRLKNLLNKQFLIESEAPQFAEYIDPNDLEIKVSATGITDLIASMNHDDGVANKYNIVTKPGVFKKTDIITVSVYVKKEAFDKYTKKQKNSIKYKSGHYDNKTEYLISTFPANISYKAYGYTVKYPKRVSRFDRLICEFILQPTRALREPSNEFAASSRILKGFNIEFNIELMQKKNIIDVTFGAGTEVPFSKQGRISTG